MNEKNKLSNLIEALQIILKYHNHAYPTCCLHDELLVLADPKLFSIEDIDSLKELGFIVNCDNEQPTGFVSYRFGS